jgi:hypothetical protein
LEVEILDKDDLDEDLDDEDTLEGETSGGDLVTDDDRLEDLEIDEILSAVEVLDIRREDVGVVELLVVAELLLEDAFVEEVWIRLDDDFGVEKALLELVFFDEICRRLLAQSQRGGNRYSFYCRCSKINPKKSHICSYMK